MAILITHKFNAGLVKRQNARITSRTAADARLGGVLTVVGAAGRGGTALRSPAFSPVCTERCAGTAAIMASKKRT